MCSCEQEATSPLPEKLETLTFFQNLNQHFILDPLPNHLSDSLIKLEGWKYSEGAIIYPLLPKTVNLSGFLSSQYGNCDNLFLVRQSHASGRGGYYDILFTLHPETGALIDEIIVGEESYLTSLRYQTVWIDCLEQYVFHVYGMDKMDSLTYEECLDNETEAICQEPVSKYFLVGDNWYFQAIKEHEIAKGRLFPFLSNQFLEAYTLNSYDKETLELMSAEIFAQYGYIFDNTRFKAYFSEQKWYRPITVENIESLLSSFERYNLELIRARVLNLE
jgi:hypothetical protein